MKIITGYAKHHRKNPTNAEKELRNKLLKWKIKFRSQRQFNYYIVDFLIPEKRLIIEVDGSYHDNRKDYDLKREAYLKSLGLNVIRITNEEVLNSDCMRLKEKILTYKDINIKNLPLRLSYGISTY